jgi:archaeosortase C (PEF-CTERM variant)
MGFRRLADLLKKRRSVSLLAALLLIFGGLDLLLNPPKGWTVGYLGLPFMAGGLLIAVVVLWPEGGLAALIPGENLASKLITVLSARGRLRPYFPVLGGLTIALDLVYNLTLSPTPALLTHDTVVILLGTTLAAYNFVPKSFAKERDFILLFFIGLTVILVIPLMVMRALAFDFTASVDAYSAVMLAPPLSGMMRLIGIENVVDGINISFTTKAGVPVMVGITTECSGLYSFSIFASAFAAFVFTEYNRIDRKVVLLLALGVFTAYLANVLRMLVIVWTGYEFGTTEAPLQALLVAHSNAGWIIFLAWIGVFWFLMFKFLVKTKPEEVEEELVPGIQRGTLCAVCGTILKVDSPAGRCVCGAYYHTACAGEAKACPSCGITLEPPSAGVPEGASV